MSDGQTSDVRQTVFPKVRGRLYIMKGAIMIKPYNRPGGRGKCTPIPLRGRRRRRQQKGCISARCAHSAENVQVSRSWPIACT